MLTMMIKGNAHGNIENEMSGQDCQNERWCFLSRGVTGQEGSGSISQNQQTTGTGSRQKDDPFNKSNGDNTKDGSWQKGDHGVSIITDPFGQSKSLKRHASGTEPKDRGNTKNKGREETPSVQEMVDVVFKFIKFVAVEGCGPVGSGLNNSKKEIN